MTSASRERSQFGLSLSRNMLVTPLSMKVFCVGDGDCIVLEFPDGAIGLVDSCVPPWSNTSPALAYLRKQGGKVAFMCLTHPHVDHYGGMLEIANDKGIEISEFWHPFSTDLYEIVQYKSFVWDFGASSVFSDLSSYESRAEEFPRLMSWARDLPAGRERAVCEGRVMRRVKGLYEIVALAPSDLATSLYTKRIRQAWRNGTAVDARYENRVSAVLLIRYGQARVILGGDASGANWHEILTGSTFQAGTDVAHCLKAADHGSKHGFSHRMWPSLVRKGAHVIVSAGSSRLASPEFIDSVSQNHTLWCTGCGPSCSKCAPSDTFQHLDSVSVAKKSEPCFGDLEVRVLPTGDVEVIPANQPPQAELRCRSGRIARTD